MTITLGKIHLAIAGAFLAGILLAVGAVVALGGGGDDKPVPAQQVSAENLDVAPTTAPTTAPSATPAPSPTPAPPVAPQIRTCPEIRATGAYNSDEERAFFLANCVNQPAASGQASNPPPSSGSSAQATAAEADYRLKAEASLVVVASRFEQYTNTPSFGAENDWLELSTIFRQFDQAIGRLPAPPPRFKQVHDQLRATSVQLADHMIKYQQLTSQAQANAWLKTLVDYVEAFNGAVEDYSLVVGIDLPDFFLPE